MNIKEIALKVAMDTGLYLDGANQSEPFYVVKPEEIVEFAEALIESYKAELLKEAGEPVLTLFQHEDTGRETTIQPHAASDFAKMNKRWFNCGDLYSARQLAAAVLKATKPLEEEVEKLSDSAYTTSERLNVYIRGNDELRTQLAAAQEENGRLENQVLARDAELWGRTQEILGLKDQLAKAERLRLYSVTKHRDLAVEAIRHCIAAMGSVTDVKKAMDWPQLHNAQMLSLQALDAIKESDGK